MADLADAVQHLEKHGHPEGDDQPELFSHT
jgi:hypothetical protein